MPNLTVVIASTRPGRAGAPIAEWFLERAGEQGGFDEIVSADLAEIGLPLLDEPNHPRLRQYTQPHTRAWSEIADAADAFVLVTPEYNHGYPASLKNALDYLHHEWKDKPVGFVSYGGISAGTRSVAQLKSVVSALGMVAVVPAVNIPFHVQFIDDERRFTPNDVLEQAARTLLDELLRWHSVLSPLRSAAVA
jgi:NAD(P)H-dependent FMN reductase